MSEDKFDPEALDMMYRISELNPFKLVQYLEEAHYYALANIKHKQQNIDKEYRYERCCKSGSEKYIKQMKKEIKVFEERERLLSIIINKIKAGEFSEVE